MPVKVCGSQNTELLAGKAAQAHHAAVTEQASNAIQQQKRKWYHWAAGGDMADLSPTLSAPTSSTTAWITSKAKRHLFSTLPPYSSVLWFGLGLMNWSIK